MHEKSKEMHAVEHKGALSTRTCPLSSKRIKCNKTESPVHRGKDEKRRGRDDAGVWDEKRGAVALSIV